MWCLLGKERSRQDFGCESMTEGTTCRRRWDNNIEMNIKEIVWEGAKWLYVARLTESLWAAVNNLMDLRGPLTF